VFLESRHACSIIKLVPRDILLLSDPSLPASMKSPYLGSERCRLEDVQSLTAN
jgi:hypothetical protein